MDNEPESAVSWVQKRIEEPRGLEYVLTSKVDVSEKKVDWSDEILKEEAKNLFLPKGREVPALRRGAIHKFFRFYLWGEIDSGSTLHSVIISAITFTLKKESTDLNYVFPETVLSDNAICPFSVSAAESYEIAPEVDRLSRQYPESEITTFAQKVMKILNDWDPTKPDSPDSIALTALAGFLAMTMMRAAVKDTRTFELTFTKPQYFNDIVAMTSWRAEYQLSPLDETAVKICMVSFQKRMDTVRKLFIIVVWIYTELKLSKEPDPSVLSVLLATCLTDTAGDGLIPIGIIIATKKFLEWDWKTLVRRTNIGFLAKTWFRVIRFLDKYCVKDKPQYSYHWCRIINDGCLKELAADDNLYWCGFFAEVVGKSQDDDRIWDSYRARKNKARIETARKYGRKFVRMCTSYIAPISAGNPEAEKLLRYQENPVDAAMAELAGMLSR